MIRGKNALKGYLNFYYDEVISFIRDAESVLIFGPGEAKTELKNVWKDTNSLAA